jgi:hypothetical protein
VPVFRVDGQRALQVKPLKMWIGIISFSLAPAQYPKPACACGLQYPDYFMENLSILNVYCNYICARGQRKEIK